MFTYRIIIILLSPFILLHLLWKSVQVKSTEYFLQRLGFGTQSPARTPVWFHCASVGETNTALPLIHQLHADNPDLIFIITTNTATSASIIKQQNKAYIQHAYLPIDWICAIRRFIRATKPSALFIIETELWPNLIHQAKYSHIKTCILNARLSSRTTNINPWMASVYRKTLNNIHHIYARSSADRENYLKLGADETQIAVTGNLKYALSAQKIAKQDFTKRPYIIAASTHDDEEIQIARCWIKLRRKELLVIAPRHPQRKNRIIQQLKALTDNVIARTDNSGITEDTKIFILDTVGELVSWFISAQAVVMGGSFVASGGHNIIEPAQQGKALIYGPHMENFQFESQLLLENFAAIQVKNYEELSQALTKTLDDDTTRTNLETAALNAVRPFETVLSSYCNIVLSHIDEENKPDA